jgi:hypothetical protein
MGSGGGSGGPCSRATAVEAVEADAVQVLLGCLASSGRQNDAYVQSEAARALAVVALALSSGGGCRQLPEPLLDALRPAVAALAGLLCSTQLPAVAEAVLCALANIAVADEALAVEAAAAGAAQLAAQWSLRLGAPEGVVRDAEGLIENLAYQGDTVSARLHVAAPQLPCSVGMESSAGQGSSSGEQMTCCAACGAASTGDGKPLKMCSACRGVSYRSEACQRRHWGEHKGACRRVG